MIFPSFVFIKLCRCYQMDSYDQFQYLPRHRQEQNIFLWQVESKKFVLYTVNFELMWERN